MLQKPKPAAPRLAIIGGGIAGLAAAYQALMSVPGADITVYEASNRLGGKLLTDRVNGFVIEGGADSFLASKPAAPELCEELGVADELIGTITENRRTYVMRDGRLHRIPEGLTGLVPSRLDPLLNSPLLSDAGKVRVAEEARVPVRPGDDDESLAAFIERRFGNELYDRLIEPLMGGIYAGDGRRLSLLATFPQLRGYERDYGSVLRGVQSRTAASPDPTTGRSGFLTLRGGLGRLVEALASQLPGVEIRGGCPIRSVTRSGGEYTLGSEAGVEFRADAVVVATPAFATSRMLGLLDSDLADAAAGIPYVSTAVIALGYESSDVPAEVDGFGYVVPRAEKRPILAATWMSNKWPNRAPSGTALLRCFIGRAGQEDVLGNENGELVRLARSELRAVVGITAQPLVTRVFRWPDAMPQYNMGHRDRVRRIREAEGRHEGLAIAGHAYEGVGIPDCIQSGRDAARRAVGL